MAYDADAPLVRTVEYNVGSGDWSARVVEFHYTVLVPYLIPGSNPEYVLRLAVADSARGRIVGFKIRSEVPPGVAGAGLVSSTNYDFRVYIDHALIGPPAYTTGVSPLHEFVLSSLAINGEFIFMGYNSFYATEDDAEYLYLWLSNHDVGNDLMQMDIVLSLNRMKVTF